MALKIIVIGAGPGGYTAAAHAAGLGGEVTLVEGDRVGGVCLNRGCIPSKVMKTTADLLDRFRRAPEFGIRNPGVPSVDMPGLVRRKNKVVDIQAGGIMALLKRRKVRYVQGRAAVRPGRSIAVAREDGSEILLEWDRLIIATGSRPRPLPFAPFDGKRVLSSDHVLDLDHVPESVAIIGGGVIGCEFAFILSALGSRVTVVEELGRLLPLPAVEESCSDILRREMKKRGIEVLVRHRAAAVAATDTGLALTLGPAPGAESPSLPHREPLAVEMMLVCIGRGPWTGDLGLEALGVARDQAGWVIADETMATSAPGVYAIGDILGPAKVMLAHAAAAEGVVAAENALGNNRRMRYDLIPTAIFTMPEVAAVGLTEARAAAEGRDVHVDRFLFRQVGKAHVIGDIAGEARLISEKAGGRILGVHIIGAQAAELIAEAVLALKTGCTVRELAETIHPHPTLAEIFMGTEGS
ncbi:MAG: dihydrolipoyl dehydrogenase [Thermodesulfobacteriota bacterium]